MPEVHVFYDKSVALNEEEAVAFLILMNHVKRSLRPGEVLSTLFDIEDCIEEAFGSLHEDRFWGSVDADGVFLTDATFEGERY